MMCCSQDNGHPTMALDPASSIWKATHMFWNIRDSDTHNNPMTLAIMMALRHSYDDERDSYDEDDDDEDEYDSEGDYYHQRGIKRQDRLPSRQKTPSKANDPPEKWKRLVAALTSTGPGNDAEAQQQIDTLSFAHGGPVPNNINPAITIQGFASQILALPIVPGIAEQLVSLAEVAPFGMGKKTVVDKTVRNGKQIGADKWTAENPLWTTTLQTIIEDVKASMGIGKSFKVEAHPYKLLVYETGGFFKPHTDTEKEPGMFGTLIVSLPSIYTGGALSVTHKSASKTFDFAAHKYELYYSAFFSDCKHELLPVTSGHRVVLTYNLVYLPSQDILATGCPSAANNGTLRLSTSDLDKWARNSNKAKPLIYVMEHSYTEAGLSFTTLKGRDRIVATNLARLEGDASISVFVAMMTRVENGDDESGECMENECNIGPSMIGRDGTKYPLDLGLKAVEYINRNIVFADGCDDETDDLWVDIESEHEGPTGNEGAPYNRWYKSAVIIVFQKKYRPSLINPTESDLAQLVAANPPRIEDLEVTLRNGGKLDVRSILQAVNTIGPSHNLLEAAIAGVSYSQIPDLIATLPSMYKKFRKDRIFGILTEKAKAFKAQKKRKPYEEDSDEEEAEKLRVNHLITLCCGLRATDALAALFSNKPVIPDIGPCIPELLANLGQDETNKLLRILVGNASPPLTHMVAQAILETGDENAFKTLIMDKATLTNWINDKPHNYMFSEKPDILMFETVKKAFAAGKFASLRAKFIAAVIDTAKKIPPEPQRPVKSFFDATLGILSTLEAHEQLIQLAFLSATPVVHHAPTTHYSHNRPEETSLDRLVQVFYSFDAHYLTVKSVAEKAELKEMFWKWLEKAKYTPSNASALIAFLRRVTNHYRRLHSPKLPKSPSTTIMAHHYKTLNEAKFNQPKGDKPLILGPITCTCDLCKQFATFVKPKWDYKEIVIVGTGGTSDVRHLALKIPYNPEVLLAPHQCTRNKTKAVVFEVKREIWEVRNAKPTKEEMMRIQVESDSIMATIKPLWMEEVTIRERLPPARTTTTGAATSTASTAPPPVLVATSTAPPPVLVATSTAPPPVLVATSTAPPLTSTSPPAPAVPLVPLGTRLAADTPTATGRRKRTKVKHDSDDY